MIKSPLALAFLGDAVITFFIRSFLVNDADNKINVLHKRASSYENAKTQAQVYDTLKLTEEEKDLAQRAFNAKVNTKAKNATLCEYRKATALEALVGFWHMNNELDKVTAVVVKLMHDC
ncbi:MAG: Mini-ribonuclease 3 [Firmicutes bacterium]|nr:Mini-ribonuclease 3 [Bacillota bacterium]